MAMMSLSFLMSALLLSTTFHATAQNRTSTAPASDNAREVIPQLFDYTQEMVLGDLWTRVVLTPRDRSLVTLSSLLANGQSAQMASHFSLALDNGMRPAEIIEIITHLMFYTGWSKSVSAAGVANDVFAQRGIEPREYRSASSELMLADAAVENGRVAFGAPDASDPALFTDEFLFVELCRRQVLAPRDRSLATMATLIARGQVDQVSFHLNRAMDKGLTQLQAAAVVTHLAFYAGWPRAMTAVPVLQAVFAERQ